MLIAVLVIGAGLLAFGGTMGQQVEKTGEAVASWTGGAIGAGDSAIESPQEKADRELAEKDPKDWTLDDQKRVAEDISANGSASKFYEKAKSAMDAGTSWSVTLTNGQAMRYRIIGIAHDDKADGSGKAGLTFRATNNGVGRFSMNQTNTNAGGWEKSVLRQKMNTGEIWNLLPTDLQSKISLVSKSTNNSTYDSITRPTVTYDKLFLLSAVELGAEDDSSWNFFVSNCPWLSHEGRRYEYNIGNSDKSGWSRTLSVQTNQSSIAFTRPGVSIQFTHFMSENASNTNPVLPAWCF